MPLTFTSPSQRIGANLLARLQNITPVVKDTGIDLVLALQDNIVREGGNPDTGAAWQALSSNYIKHKRAIGAFLTILRRFDKLRKGIQVIDSSATSFRVSVRGDAREYFSYVNAKRKFLGFPKAVRDRAKIRLSKHLKRR